MLVQVGRLLAVALLLAAPAAAQVYNPPNALVPGGALFTLGSTGITYGGTTTTVAGLTLTSPTIATQLTVSTGASNTVIVCKGATLTTYNFVSLNGTCTDNSVQGIFGGGDTALYLANASGGNFQFRSNGVNVATVTSAGVLAVGSIGDIKDQNFVVSTSVLNKTDTNFALIPGLTMTLTAGKSYNCYGHLTVTAAPAAGGIKVALATPNTLTVTSMSLTAANYNGTTTNARSTVTALATAAGAATATATDIDIQAGIVVNAAGTLEVHAAQNAASGTTTVGTNSTFSCKRVS